VQSYHENWEFRRTPPDFLGRVQAIHFGHLEIDDHHVRGGLLNLVYGFPTVGGFAADLPGILLLQQLAQAAPHKRVIVGDENSDGR
jgi:hypothetical protein